jgi:hypothetical protein
MTEDAMKSFQNSYLNKAKLGNQASYQMFQRFESGKTAVLSFPVNQENTSLLRWYILQAEKKQLWQDIHELKALLGVQRFRKNSETLTPLTDLEQQAIDLFPECMVFDTPVSSKEQVLNALEIWLKLVARRPAIGVNQVDTVYHLRSRFRDELATGLWDDAYLTLQRLYTSHLIDDANYHYLLIHWYALQNKWKQITELDSFESILSYAQIPKRIRIYILQSAYFSWFQAKDHAETEKQYALNVKLFEVRFQLEFPGIVKILQMTSIDEYYSKRLLAYYWHAQKDKERLEELLGLQLDSVSKKLVAWLSTQLEDSAGERNAPESLLETYLQNGDFQSYVLEARNVEDKLERFQCFLEIIFDFDDIEFLSECRKMWDAFSEPEQSRLSGQKTLAKPLKYLQKIQLPTQQILTAEDELFDLLRSRFDWKTWFQCIASSKEAYTELREIYNSSSIEYEDYSIITDEVILSVQEFLIQIFDQMTQYNETYRNLIMQSLGDFLNKLTSDPSQFPKSIHSEYYNIFLLVLFEYAKFSANNLLYIYRLIDAYIEENHASVNGYWLFFKNWLHTQQVKPSVHRLQLFIDLFELFIRHNAEPSELREFWANWTAALQSQFELIELTSATSWIEFGKLINVDKHLLDLVESKLLDKSSKMKDPLASAGKLQVTIFILEQGLNNAQEAVKRLQPRNQAIKYGFNTETDCSKTTDAAAKHADLVMLVYRLTTHAIFYGIKPLCSEKLIYAPSNGMSGIARTLEEEIVKRFALPQ